VHAVPRIPETALAQRRADERRDARDGSWRVYVASLIALCGVIVAFACVGVRVCPIRAVYEVVLPHDVVGASATLAVVIAAVLALVCHQRAQTKSALASMCVVYAWIVLVAGVPILLIAVLVSRFGLSA
jgi:hypothetical protein